jgi:hypothetical protein
MASPQVTAPSGYTVHAANVPSAVSATAVGLQTQSEKAAFCTTSLVLP